MTESADVMNGASRSSARAGATSPASRMVAVDASSATIPVDILHKWQRIVDLLASIVQVPSAVVTALEPPRCADYVIVVSSNSKGNPFPVDDVFSMEIGTFCETVIKTRQPLLVADALENEQWRSAPETRVGMVSYLGYPVFLPDGRVFGTICVLDDKANRYSDRYQELLLHCRDVLQGDLQTLARLGGELEQQKAHLRELFARVPEAVVMVDRDSMITQVNPEFTKVFGYTAEEALGRRIKDLITPDDLQDEAEDVMYRLLQQREVFAVETVRRHKSGARVPVSLVCVPVSTNGAEHSGYVIYRDITATKRLQDEQRRHHEMEMELAHANRIATLGQLSASIAHEINQPLTGIITNCNTGLRMLSGNPVNLDGTREVMRRIMRDGNRASAVVTRLRALFARQGPASESVDLSEVTREVIALSLGEIRKGQVILRTELADGLPAVTADRVQLQQVVLNLLRNALDAMAAVDNRPRDLLIKAEMDEGQRVRLSMKDAGMGFDPHSVDKLFDAFYSTKSDGMGMGLSVSRSIVENHNGRLWAELNDGPGSTFSFSMPCSGSG